MSQPPSPLPPGERSSSGRSSAQESAAAAGRPAQPAAKFSSMLRSTAHYDILSTTTQPPYSLLKTARFVQSGRKPPFFAVKRPAGSYTTAIERQCTAENAEGRPAAPGGRGRRGSIEGTSVAVTAAQSKARARAIATAPTPQPSSRMRLPSPGATLSFDTVVGWRWLPFLRDLQSNLAAITVTFCENDGVALCYACPRSSPRAAPPPTPPSAAPPST